MKHIKRRDFMKGSLAAAVSLTWPSRAFARVRGANDDIRAAVVGFRNQGKNHINWFRKLLGVRVVAICDVDKRILNRGINAFKKLNEKVDAYTDVRKMLEDKNIDIVIIATPNHWHALITVWACQAGKDVYVEKPVSHNIREGRKMVEAARKYDRIVQAGTQRRSDRGLQEAIQYVRQGNLGKIKYVRGLCYVRRGSIGKVDGPQPVPPEVDYNLWTGPAPLAPLMRKKLHYDWHWVWPTGNGDFGNNGIHFIDTCRWMLDQNTLPDRVMSIGGRFGYIDDGQTPNTQIVFLDYHPAPIIFELRGLPHRKDAPAMDEYRGMRTGIIVQCEHGYFAGGWAYDNDGKKIKQFNRDGGGIHKANFIKAVRSRKLSDLNAEILEGHLSSALCHMGNISYRLGKKTSRAEVMEAIKGNKEMVDSFERFQNHLLLNGVDLDKTPRILGPWLRMDTDHERFVGEFSDQANELVSRKYRQPFVLPEPEQV